MEQLIKITERNGEQVVSARNLYEALDIKNHFTQWFDDNKVQFDENIDYQAIKAYVNHDNGIGGTNRIDYALTIDCAKELAMLSKVPKGKEVRKYFIACEKAVLRPRTHLEVIDSERVLLVENIRVSNLLLEATDKIEQDKSKVVFAESVIGSSNSILVRQFAKDLCDSGFEIGQNRVFEWLREKKYLNKDNEPYQNHVASGLFEVVTRTIGSGLETFTTKTTKITGKGQIYFADKIKVNK
jgi:anti-repressor protein